MQRTISIVIPIYNEAPNVTPLYRAVKEIIKKLPQSFELIFVDDGSSDDSVRRIKQVAKKDKEVRVVELARNFGKEIAVTAGIHAAHGDAAVIMDADLQHPPELLPKFIDEWEKGADVVVGVKENSKMMASLAVPLISRLSGSPNRYCSTNMYEPSRNDAIKINHPSQPATFNGSML